MLVIGLHYIEGRRPPSPHSYDIIRVSLPFPDLFRGSQTAFGARTEDIRLYRQYYCKYLKGFFLAFYTCQFKFLTTQEYLDFTVLHLMKVRPFSLRRMKYKYKEQFTSLLSIRCLCIKKNHRRRYVSQAPALKKHSLETLDPSHTIMKSSRWNITCPSFIDISFHQETWYLSEWGRSQISKIRKVIGGYFRRWCKSRLRGFDFLEFTRRRKLESFSNKSRQDLLIADVVTRSTLTINITTTALLNFDLHSRRIVDASTIALLDFLLLWLCSTLSFLGWRLGLFIIVTGGGSEGRSGFAGTLTRSSGFGWSGGAGFFGRFFGLLAKFLVVLTVVMMLVKVEWFYVKNKYLVLV